MVELLLLGVATGVGARAVVVVVVVVTVTVTVSGGAAAAGSVGAMDAAGARGAAGGWNASPSRDMVSGDATVEEGRGWCGERMTATEESAREPITSWSSSSSLSEESKSVLTPIRRLKSAPEPDMEAGRR